MSAENLTLESQLEDFRSDGKNIDVRAFMLGAISYYRVLSARVLRPEITRDAENLSEALLRTVVALKRELGEMSAVFLRDPEAKRLGADIASLMREAERTVDRMLGEQEKPCHLKFCLGRLLHGQPNPAAISCNEVTDDGAWRVEVCQDCADALLVVEGSDLLEPEFVRRTLTRAARERQEASRQAILRKGEGRDGRYSEP